MGGSDNFLINIAPIFIIFIIFYFFLIRPQQKKIKEHKIMVASLKRGDEIVTSGGIIGKVEKILGDDKIQVQISENVFIQVVQSTVQNVTNNTAIKK